MHLWYAFATRTTQKRPGHFCVAGFWPLLMLSSFYVFILLRIVLKLFWFNEVRRTPHICRAKVATSCVAQHFWQRNRPGHFCAFGFWFAFKLWTFSVCLYCVSLWCEALPFGSRLMGFKGAHCEYMRRGVVTAHARMCYIHICFKIKNNMHFWDAFAARNSIPKLLGQTVRHCKRPGAFVWSDFDFWSCYHNFRYVYCFVLFLTCFD